MSLKRTIPVIAKLRDAAEDPKASAADREQAARALKFFGAPEETQSEKFSRRLAKVRQASTPR